MRRIPDLVKMGVLGAASGTIISVPIVYFLGEDGVVPSLICGAAISLIVSWWYSRKITIRTPSMTLAQIGHEAAGLLKLGLALMASGLMMTGASYAIRVFLCSANSALKPRDCINLLGPWGECMSGSFSALWGPIFTRA